MKPATSNLSCSCGYRDPTSHVTRIKSGYGHVLGELPDIWGFPFNISATADASDFKFGRQLGFEEADHKITPIGKVWVSLGYPQNFGVPL